MLVGRVLQAHYFDNSTLLQAGLGTWRGIHTTIGLVKNGTRWKVGEGSMVCIWGESWYSDSGFSLTTPLVPSFDDMVVRDLYIPGTRQWYS